MQLAAQYGIEMPLAHEVFEVVQGRSTATRAFRGLLRTTAGAESEAG